MNLPATYPHWVFDASPIEDTHGHGERAVNFLRNLRHPKSTLPGYAFQLDPWMERIIRRIYGPRHPDGTRVVKNVFLMVPRGNRKTTLGAAIALLHEIGPERVFGGQVVLAAADQKQARIAFEEAANTILEDSRLKKVADVFAYRNRIVGAASRTVLEAISSDGATQYGRTPALVLADEIHAWKKRDLWEALRTGLVKTPGSLQVIITTAGRGLENIGFDQYDYARRVALGEIVDPATLPIIFEAPRDCDWKDEEVWHAVNPGLRHGYPDLEGLRQLAREAEHKPRERASFQCYHLNIWQDHSTSPFVDMAVYDEGGAPIDDAVFEGLPCWIGVDASQTTDLTAVVACFRNGDDYTVLPTFFVPGDNLRRRGDKDKVDYVEWEKSGFVVATPGNVIDYTAIEQHIRDLCSRFDVREIAFDPAYSRQISVPLMEDGFPIVEFRQGWRTMGPAIKELERAIIGRSFRHGGNPVLRWNFENIAIQTDSSGNISFHKGKSRDRIDGAVATAMAVARAATGESGTSVYNDENARPEGLLFI